jgi:hypothetical protein
MSISTDDLGRITQQTSVLASDGDRLGTINQIYTSDTTGEPAWVTVKTGLFGTQESFVPLAEASFEGDDIRVPVTKKAVHDAPRVDADGHLSVEEEDDLYRYYGLQNPRHPGGDVTAGDRRDDDRTGTDRAEGLSDRGDRDDRDDDRGTDRGHTVAAAGAGAAGAAGMAGAAVADRGRDDEPGDRSLHAEDGPERVGSDRSTGSTGSAGSTGSDDDTVEPGERTTQLRRYVVTERVVRTVEELPDEPSR